jgi:Family of unknown function (DUF5681)
MTAATTTANSGKNSGRIENLRPWKKGQSGNPLGRPKKTLITDALRAKLAEVDSSDALGRTNAEIIADCMIARAKAKGRGQQDAAEIADRTEGRPKQKVDVAAEISTVSMTEAQLDKSIMDLIERARSRAGRQHTST